MEPTAASTLNRYLRKMAMVLKVVARVSKIIGALSAVMVGVWAIAVESARPLVMDAVTNVQLIEIFAPKDGNLTHYIAEGELFSLGAKLASTMAPESKEVPAEEAKVHEGVNVTAALAKTQSEFAIQNEELGKELARLGLLDRRTDPQIEASSVQGTPQIDAAETTLVSETSGMIWDWKGNSGSFFELGESVGYVADCQNLIAVGEAQSLQTSIIHVGDPVLFVTSDSEWQGSVQRIVAGVPNLPGQYAMNFPKIAPTSSLLIVSLDNPPESQGDCAFGVSGKIHYPDSASRSPNDIAAQVVGGVKKIVHDAWNVIGPRTPTEVPTPLTP